MTIEILAELGPVCRDAARRALIQGNPALGLNGIDFVEYRHSAVPPEHVLEVHFLDAVPAGAYGLLLPANLGLIGLDGGERVVGIEAKKVTVGADPRVLNIEIDAQGDFSEYVLSLGWSRDATGSWFFGLAGVDRAFSVAPVHFRAGCPVEFDCRVVPECPPERLPEPLLDYMARDYASFRQLLVDFLAQRNPVWVERNPSDLGIALLELFAYEGDHLAYYQDAVSNEATLDTARRRVSAKRHARLVDYAMHDGRNAWTFVHVAVTTDGTLPFGQKLLTKISATLRREKNPPSTLVGPLGTPSEEQEQFDTDPPLVAARVFETATHLDAFKVNNEIRLHTWGNEACCLPRGTTTVHLYVVTGGTAARPKIEKGDLLLLEEIGDPETGTAALADPMHRQVVHITHVRNLVDPVFAEDLAAGKLQLFPGASGNPLPLLEVSFSTADALGFPLCLSAKPAGAPPLTELAMARGNVVLADHGRTVSETVDLDEPLPSAHDGGEANPGESARFRLPLTHAPLTMQIRPEKVVYDPASGALLSERPDLQGDARQAQPSIGLLVTGGSPAPEVWEPEPNLLDSTAFDRHFVADVEDDGRPTLRFGDGDYGREPSGATKFSAVYRVGNGRAGNIAADALAHVVLPAPMAALLAAVPPWPMIAAIRNPLAAEAGTDPETIEETRQYAPAAFRARQFRAVTEADYTDAARTIKGVAGAVAAFRWTGSWYTVFVGIDPEDTADLIVESGGRTRLSDDFSLRVRNGLTRYKLAAYDLEIRAGLYVSLRIAIELCAEPGYFRGDVGQAVRRALGTGEDAFGRRGFFHPANFTFGQPVTLSALYAAVGAVEGVDSSVVTVFQRYGREARGELDSGLLPIGSWEIARLDNDPNRMENGVLTLTARGGK
jgi:hypothetical protein